MSVILVDFENVFEHGLLGIDLLKETDTLKLFYSKGCEDLRREYVEIIRTTGCLFEACKLLNKGPDYLDKYIATSVGEYYKSGETEIGIISKDRGYQAIIDYYKISGVDDIRVVKADNIEQALSSFGDPKDRDRRAIIAERSKKIKIDEISNEYKEKELIKKNVRSIFSDPPYNCNIEKILEYVLNNKNSGKKVLYTKAMHKFGRKDGQEIYNRIKKVI